MSAILRYVAFGSLIFSAACASQPETIPSQYVSEAAYKHHSCDRLVMEARRVSARTGELFDLLNTKANVDVVQLGVGLIWFWPTLLFIEAGDGPKAAEYARIKGQAEAIERAAVTKECDLTFRGAPPFMVRDAQCRPVVPDDAARPEMKQALAAYYKMYPIQRSRAHDGIAITLQAIDDVTVVDISGNVLTLDVAYRADMAHQGVATVIACGSNYNVLYFGDQPS